MNTPRALASFTLATLATMDGPTLRDTARAMGVETKGHDNTALRAMLRPAATDASAAPVEAPAAPVEAPAAPVEAPAAPASFLAFLGAAATVAPAVGFPAIPDPTNAEFPATVLRAYATVAARVAARTPDAADSVVATRFAEALNAAGFEAFGPYRDATRRYPAKSDRAGRYYWTTVTATALRAACEKYTAAR